MAYDVIGDIHGQAEKLHGLLKQLGYRETSGAYRHPDRTALFVGDLIDRGPQQIDSIMTVRRMVDAGSAMAVMGNHEFNAIAWHTPHPCREHDFLRTHSGELGRRNRAQHEAFLLEVEGDLNLHQEIIDWFLTLPLWLDLPGLRVVHACWHQGYVDELRTQLTDTNQLSKEFMVLASTCGTLEFRAIEALTKGLEVNLPDGHMFHDKDGHVRHNVRIRWWDSHATTYRALALMDDALRQNLPETAIADDVRCPYDDAKPVLFGHYWMKGVPQVQSPLFACVDYSAARDGPLVAYRWDGEPTLNDKCFSEYGRSTI
jgi:hypothetical protein